MKPFKVMKSISGTAPVVTVDIFNTSCTHSVVDPADATATYRLNSSGTGNRTGSANWTWLLTGNNSDVEVRATLNSGALTSGTVGSWMNLSTTRTWTVSRTTVGSGAANVAIEIRRVSDSVVIDTATVTFSATVTAAGPDVQLFDTEGIDVELDPADASTAATFSSSGTFSITGNSSFPGTYSWLISGTNSDVDIKVDVTSGSFTSGSTVGSWLNLGTTRSWTLTRTTVGLNTVDATVQLRDASTLSVLAGPVQFDFLAMVDV